jgi:hypothetical protein
MDTQRIARDVSRTSKAPPGTDTPSPAGKGLRKRSRAIRGSSCRGSCRRGRGRRKRSSRKEYGDTKVEEDGVSKGRDPEHSACLRGKDLCLKRAGGIRASPGHFARHPDGGIGEKRCMTLEELAQKLKQSRGAMVASVEGGAWWGGRPLDA